MRKSGTYLAFVTSVVVLMQIFIFGCTNGTASKRTLENAGYRNVEITGYRWTGCSDTEHYHTGFRAVGPTGRTVSGVVCEGGWLGKGKTIRLD